MSSQKPRRAALRQTLIAASVAACFSFSSQQASANPSGGSAVSGTAGFATVGNTLTITNSANAIINWQGFSIGVNEITRFLQTSAGSAVLNRVVGVNGVIPQSVIDGVLSSNGRVFLINPMGVVFGAGAQIDVAGLVASSLNLSNEDFLAGRMRFTEVPGAGAVINRAGSNPLQPGWIQTPSGGRVFLVAPDVQNTGIIRAPQGEIVLAAGKSAELVNEDSPYVTVKVVADAEQALNVGSLIADSGRIGMYGALVRNTGIAEASAAVAGPGGSIRFVATKDLTLDAGSRTAANGMSGGDILLQAQGGTNLISGTVEAKGSAGNGGNVQALGVRVGVIGHGVIDASGDTGGGTVLVGGDYQGKNASVQNAEQTLIGSDGVIRADAGTTGDGGRVIVWSDQYTRFFGSVSVRGGAQSGNGGFVETSGHVLDALGRVNLGAPKGKGGTWLLDPFDLEIVDTGMTVSPSTQTTVLFTDAPTTGTSTLGMDVINNGLAFYGGSVTAQAQHDITFATTGTNVNFGAGTVTAQAGNNVNLGSHNIVGNGTSFNVIANDTSAGYGSGVGSILSNSGFGNISTMGGWVSGSGKNITLGNINTGGAASTNTTVSLNASGGMLAVGNISTGDASGLGSASTSVSLSATYGIAVGSIATGNSTVTNFGGASSRISLFGGFGGVTVGGMLKTGAASAAAAYGGDSTVYGTANGGTFSVGGDITTGSATNSSRVSIVNSNGSISTRSITTGDAGGYVYGASSNISLFNFFGNLQVNGNLKTGNATASSAYIYGTADSDIFLSGETGSSVTGSITTGNAFSPNYFAASYVSLNSDAGGISAGSIATGNATGGTQGDTGVYFTAGGGSVMVNGSIQTGSAMGGAYGFSGVFADYYGNPLPAGGFFSGAITTGSSTTDSSITVQAGTGITTGNLSTGASGTALVEMSANDSISSGDITTGAGSTITGVIMDTLAGSITTGSINVGVGGPSASSGVSIFSGGSVSTGNIMVAVSADSGVGIGAFGDVTTGSITTRSFDPNVDGATVFLISETGSVKVNDMIDTRGANGTATHPSGSAGGDVFIAAPVSVSVGPTATLGISRTVIDTSGGAGAAGGSGGSAGSIFVDPAAILFNGNVFAKGGAGSGAAGGNGGSLFLDTTNGVGTITFINGGYDVTGGTGSPPGLDGLVTANGTLIFATLLSPLTDPAVAQAIGSTISSLLTTTSQNNESSSEDKSKKVSAGSCKP